MKTITVDDEDRIVAEITNCFATFGGGRGSAFNPLAEWTKDKPPMFAMGVDVRAVVRFVATSVEMEMKKRMKKPRRRARFGASR